MAGHNRRAFQRVYSYVAVLAAVFFLHRPRCACAQMTCPWERQYLSMWDDALSWSPDPVPSEFGHAVIHKGKHVLLNVSPPQLSSLTIQPGASLVWGNVEGLELWTEVIDVQGEFIMGSQDCWLDRAANIKFLGHPNSTTFIADQGEEVRKGMVVRNNGSLQIHGRHKTPWTRLARSLPAMFDLACTAVYNHGDHVANPFAEERGQGLHVIVWNEDGSVADFTVFVVFTQLREFVDKTPDGKFIGMTAFGRWGLDDRSLEQLDWPTLDDVIHGLGGQLVTQASRKDFYALVTVKGAPHKTKEFYKREGQVDMDDDERYMQIPNWNTKLAFQVATSARTSFQFFRVVPTDVAYPVLELAEPVQGWLPGDKIVVASTDFDWTQAEVREIVDCPECSSSQVRVNESFRYRHYGNFTFNVDERAEVGMLSHNIFIEGVTEEECTFQDLTGRRLCERFHEDTFGGHIMIVKGHHSVHISGVELYHMGQQGFMGRYPVHFHMCDEVHHSVVKDIAIHHSFQRCVTIHGTDYAEVSGVVCYIHLGHGFFLEDSVEQNNVLSNNLGLGTKHGSTLMSDLYKDWCMEEYPRKLQENCDEVSTFWITHPNNILKDNAAAGGEGHGFMYVFAPEALGPSYERQKILNKVPRLHARRYPIKLFYNNVAHSYKRSGLFVDSWVSTGRLEEEYGVPENGIMQEENYYEPRDPPGDPNGARVWTKMERFTAYKNAQNNLWLKGGNINVTYSAFADSAGQSVSGGTTGFWSGVAIDHSILIGRTDNLGEPRYWIENIKGAPDLAMTFPGSVGRSPWESVTGVGIYQGPYLLTNTFFDRFFTLYWNDSWSEALGKRPVTPSGAVSFKKDATYPIYSSQYTRNLTFGYCDNEKNGHWLLYGNATMYGWEEYDAWKNVYNMDKDGSLTGTPNTAIVSNRPFFTGPECINRTDWGKLSICPYRYIKVDVAGKGGSLDESLKKDWPLVGRRDDAPHDHFLQESKQRREYLVRTHKSYLIGLNTTKNKAKFPDEIKVFGYGVEKQDVVRVGMCLPFNTTDYDISMEYPHFIRRNNYSRANSLQELDDSDFSNLTIYHDTANQILFFKIWSLYDRTNDTQMCTAGYCYMLRIFLYNGNFSHVRDCFDVDVPPYQDKRGMPPPDPPAEPTKCSPAIGSPEGIGAVRYDEITKIVHEEFQPPCAPIPQPAALNTEYQGCFVDLGKFEVDVMLRKTMTIEWCTRRCFYRNYRYAALTRGSNCQCGQEVDFSAEALDIGGRQCNKECTGNKKQDCGNGERLAIWSTGYDGMATVL